MSRSDLNWRNRYRESPSVCSTSSLAETDAAGEARIVSMKQGAQQLECSGFLTRAYQLTQSCGLM